MRAKVALSEYIKPLPKIGIALLLEFLLARRAGLGHIELAAGVRVVLRVQQHAHAQHAHLKRELAHGDNEQRGVNNKRRHAIERDRAGAACRERSPEISIYAVNSAPAHACEKKLVAGSLDNKKNSKRRGISRVLHHKNGCYDGGRGVTAEGA